MLCRLPVFEYVKTPVEEEQGVDDPFDGLSNPVNPLLVLQSFRSRFYCVTHFYCIAHSIETKLDRPCEVGQLFPVAGRFNLNDTFIHGSEQRVQLGEKRFETNIRTQ